MQVPRIIITTLQLAMLALITVGVLLGGWWLLNLDVNTEQTQYKLQMSRLQVSAQIYYSRLQYYEGVCNDIGLPAGWRCNSNEAGYAVEFDLGTGRFYCMDSAGFLGETRVSKGVTVACRDY
ncbi:hypothetical protein A2392_03180 [Candidatus Kaiserbacteria bacterium RIFOXYB1_FULL_46_14]|uniref:Type II secretion system protein GspG C-terminal domain-containing protein n=1 Tax=Candidatus Kaiserbacteria bacterium RIFOXYB1_FULL_46_14 TaxID=1798531 RepID=A0A1F6FJD9_9BACT|nr:MAG: hypothetical protein A2392_03180 [Candidatus Kaiserbacteria bacterium RIFOXYB1_FULL_46_14]